jgi:hypothetical protein
MEEFSQVANRINAVHKKIRQRLEAKEPFTLKAATRLVGIYSDSIDRLESVLSGLKSLAGRRRKRKSSDTAPIAKKSRDEQFLRGEQVAARFPHEWILAVVIDFHQDKSRYEVEDVEDDEDTGTRKFVVN